MPSSMAISPRAACCMASITSGGTSSPSEPLLSDGVRHGSEISTGFLFAEHRRRPKVLAMRVTV